MHYELWSHGDLLWTDRINRHDTTENITFPQLRHWWAVKIKSGKAEDGSKIWISSRNYWFCETQNSEDTILSTFLLFHWSCVNTDGNCCTKTEIWHFIKKALNNWDKSQVIILRRPFPMLCCPNCFNWTVWIWSENLKEETYTLFVKLGN